VFAPAFKAPTSLLREAEASGVSVFRTEKFGRRKSICQEFNVLISISVGSTYLYWILHSFFQTNSF